jgi:choline dehydrogenase-like flavoprotein
MILDARDRTVTLSRRAEVLIVGAGPAGTALAERLASKMEVVLIEGGRLEGSPALDRLNTGGTLGRSYPLVTTRTRRVGGSLALWAGWIAAFDEHDFWPHPAPSFGHWPFERSALEAYFAAAAHRLNLKDLCFDASELAGRSGVPLPFDTAIVRTNAWRFGTPTLRFEESDRARLDSFQNLTLLTDLHAVDLILSRDHDRIDRVTVRTLDGREGTILPGIAVLACGGLETPRLLLNSNRQIAGGIANSSGLVGRCFMEHPHMTFDALELDRPDLFSGALSPQRDDLGREFMLNFGLTPEFQRASRILNGRVHVFRTPDMAVDERPKVGVFLEQVPNPASRLTLVGECDRLGVKKLMLDWQLCELDWSTCRTIEEASIEAFEQAGAGRRVRRMAVASESRDVLHSNHHLGTTRMASNPDDGVVDANCRAHDVDNLYIVGGSVFPTGSWANPTFTVMAMTYRLADHLRGLRPT